MKGTHMVEARSCDKNIMCGEIHGMQQLDQWGKVQQSAPHRVSINTTLTHRSKQQASQCWSYLATWLDSYLLGHGWTLT